jgi:hypothetical protein
MVDSNWRKSLDLLIDKNLSELILETKNYDFAIKGAKDKSKAQIWVALAILNHKINRVYLDCNGKNLKPGKIPKDELKNILDTLEKL